MKFLKPYKTCSLSDVTQGFIQTHHAIDWLPKRKLGLGAYGTPLVAPEDGIIHTAYTHKNLKDDDNSALLKNGFGLWIFGDSGYEHLLWHTQSIQPVAVGDRVKKGQIVAYMGNSGNVFDSGVYVPLEERNKPNFLGTHLHQQIALKGQLFNPLDFIDFETEPSYTILDELKAISITLLKISNILK